MDEQITRECDSSMLNSDLFVKEDADKLEDAISADAIQSMTLECEVLSL
ncbi:hypothetical protein C5167_009431 [Papaver somniferum]|uniref:Uncharacterized protein n=1 Tax=Papaver somniferum TaxID=3469 RepID=A0A4Y7JYI8_PAPSO|nr:hypothetical protein C5167_009431 [Papaver somniferum]